uniref:Small ribosomal subunit protein uS4c n=1 Tax=Koshicola spirodelophila TaxID=1707787 RepID=A0A160E6W0_9CHLO|nr:ribosomal protein S4 [Koshicola spirodelophila]
MSRYIGPRLRITRRLGPLIGLTRKKPTLKPLYPDNPFSVRKIIPPGQHGRGKLFKKKPYESCEYDFLIRLKLKQRLRYHYGITEKQLIKYVKLARKTKGSTGRVLLRLLEMRLDNIVFRLHMAPTIQAARQLISHGHILVNKKRVNIPSYQCQPKDLITVAPKIRSMQLVSNFLTEFDKEKNRFQRILQILQYGKKGVNRSKNEVFQKKSGASASLSAQNSLEDKRFSKNLKQKNQGLKSPFFTSNSLNKIYQIKIDHPGYLEAQGVGYMGRQMVIVQPLFSVQDYIGKRIPVCVYDKISKGFLNIPEGMNAGTFGSFPTGILKKSLSFNKQGKTKSNQISEILVAYPVNSLKVDLQKFDQSYFSDLIRNFGKVTETKIQKSGQVTSSSTAIPEKKAGRREAQLLQNKNALILIDGLLFKNSLNAATAKSISIRIHAVRKMTNKSKSIFSAAIERKLQSTFTPFSKKLQNETNSPFSSPKGNPKDLINEREKDPAAFREKYIYGFWSPVLKGTQTRFYAQIENSQKFNRSNTLSSKNQLKDFLNNPVGKEAGNESSSFFLPLSGKSKKVVGFQTLLKKNGAVFKKDAPPLHINSKEQQLTSGVPTGIFKNPTSKLQKPELSENWKLIKNDFLNVPVGNDISFVGNATQKTLIKNWNLLCSSFVLDNIKKNDFLNVPVGNEASTSFLPESVLLKHKIINNLLINSQKKHFSMTRPFSKNWLLFSELENLFNNFSEESSLQENKQQTVKKSLKEFLCKKILTNYVNKVHSQPLVTFPMEKEPFFETKKFSLNTSLIKLRIISIFSLFLNKISSKIQISSAELPEYFKKNYLIGLKLITKFFISTTIYGKIKDYAFFRGLPLLNFSKLEMNTFKILLVQLKLLSSNFYLNLTKDSGATNPLLFQEKQNLKMLFQTNQLNSLTKHFIYELLSNGEKFFSNSITHLSSIFLTNQINSSNNFSKKIRFFEKLEKLKSEQLLKDQTINLIFVSKCLNKIKINEKVRLEVGQGTDPSKHKGEISLPKSVTLAPLLKSQISQVYINQIKRQKIQKEKRKILLTILWSQKFVKNFNSVNKYSLITNQIFKFQTTTFFTIFKSIYPIAYHEIKMSLLPNLKNRMTITQFANFNNLEFGVNFINMFKALSILGKKRVAFLNIPVGTRDSFSLEKIQLVLDKILLAMKQKLTSKHYIFKLVYLKNITKQLNQTKFINILMDFSKNQVINQTVLQKKTILLKILNFKIQKNQESGAPTPLVKFKNPIPLPQISYNYLIQNIIGNTSYLKAYVMQENIVPNIGFLNLSGGTSLQKSIHLNNVVFQLEFLKLFSSFNFLSPYEYRKFLSYFSNKIYNQQYKYKISTLKNHLELLLKIKALTNKPLNKNTNNFIQLQRNLISYVDPYELWELKSFYFDSFKLKNKILKFPIKSLKLTNFFNPKFAINWKQVQLFESLSFYEKFYKLEQLNTRQLLEQHQYELLQIKLLNNFYFLESFLNKYITLLEPSSPESLKFDNNNQFSSFPTGTFKKSLLLNYPLLENFLFISLSIKKTSKISLNSTQTNIFLQKSFQIFLDLFLMHTKVVIKNNNFITASVQSLNISTESQKSNLFETVLKQSLLGSYLKVKNVYLKNKALLNKALPEEFLNNLNKTFFSDFPSKLTEPRKILKRSLFDHNPGITAQTIIFTHLIYSQSVNHVLKENLSDSFFGNVLLFLTELNSNYGFTYAISLSKETIPEGIPSSNVTLPMGTVKKSFLKFTEDSFEVFFNSPNTNIGGTNTDGRFFQFTKILSTEQRTLVKRLNFLLKSNLITKNQYKQLKILLNKNVNDLWEKSFLEFNNTSQKDIKTIENEIRNAVFFFVYNFSKVVYQSVRFFNLINTSQNISNFNNNHSLQEHYGAPTPHYGAPTPQSFKKQSFKSQQIFLYSQKISKLSNFLNTRSEILLSADFKNSFNLLVKTTNLKKMPAYLTVSFLSMLHSKIKYSINKTKLHSLREHLKNQFFVSVNNLEQNVSLSSREYNFYKLIKKCYKYSMNGFTKTDLLNSKPRKLNFIEKFNKKLKHSIYLLRLTPILQKQFSLMNPTHFEKIQPSQIIELKKSVFSLISITIKQFLKLEQRRKWKFINYRNYKNTTQKILQNLKQKFIQLVSEHTTQVQNQTFSEVNPENLNNHLKSESINKSGAPNPLPIALSQYKNKSESKITKEFLFKKESHEFLFKTWKNLFIFGIRSDNHQELGQNNHSLNYLNFNKKFFFNLNITNKQKIRSFLEILKKHIIRYSKKSYIQQYSSNLLTSYLKANRGGDPNLFRTKSEVPLGRFKNDFLTLPVGNVNKSGTPTSLPLRITNKKSNTRKVLFNIYKFIRISRNISLLQSSKENQILICKGLNTKLQNNYSGFNSLLSFVSSFTYFDSSMNQTYKSSINLNEKFKLLNFSKTDFLNENVPVENDYLQGTSETLYKFLIFNYAAYTCMLKTKTYPLFKSKYFNQTQLLKNSAVFKKETDLFHYSYLAKILFGCNILYNFNSNFSKVNLIRLNIKKNLNHFKNTYLQNEYIKNLQLLLKQLVTLVNQKSQQNFKGFLILTKVLSFRTFLSKYFLKTTPFPSGTMKKYTINSQLANLFLKKFTKHLITYTQILNNIYTQSGSESSLSLSSQNTNNIKNLLSIKQKLKQKINQRKIWQKFKIFIKFFSEYQIKNSISTPLKITSSAPQANSDFLNSPVENAKLLTFINKNYSGRWGLVILRQFQKQKMITKKEYQYSLSTFQQNIKFRIKKVQNLINTLWKNKNLLEIGTGTRLKIFKNLKSVQVDKYNFLFSEIVKQFFKLQEVEYYQKEKKNLPSTTLINLLDSIKLTKGSNQELSPRDFKNLILLLKKTLKRFWKLNQLRIQKIINKQQYKQIKQKILNFYIQKESRIFNQSLQSSKIKYKKQSTKKLQTNVKIDKQTQSSQILFNIISQLPPRIKTRQQKLNYYLGKLWSKLSSDQNLIKRIEPQLKKFVEKRYGPPLPIPPHLSLRKWKINKTNASTKKKYLILPVGVVHDLASRKSVGIPILERFIVEYYSRK